MTLYHLKIVAIAILLIAGLFNAGQASYLTVKAQLSQILLDSAWELTIVTGERVRPWPWADIQPAAKLTLPRFHYSQIVLATHSSESMAFGPGLIEFDNSVVLAGHRDSHFAILEHVKLTDEIVLYPEDGSEILAVVVAKQIVDIAKQSSIVPPDNSLLLITCYPFNTIKAGGPLRLVITADKKMPG